MQKSQHIRKIIIIVIFCILVFAPLGCLVLGIDAPIHLTNSAPEPRPDFSFRDLWNGSYQKAFEAYWNSDFPNHHLLTKAYNELRYSLLNQCASPYIKGKDGYLYNELDITEMLCLDLNRRRTSDDCNRYIDALLSVKEKAEMLGKKVSLILTPSKVSFTSNNLPSQYTFAEQAYEIGNADLLRKLLKERGISYTDGNKVLQSIPQENFPFFGKSGIHWTLSASAEALMDLAARAEAVPFMVLGHYSTTDRRYAQDEDVWNVLNIWSKIEDQFVYPVVTEREPQGNRSYPNILMQGGSFAFPLADLFIESATAQRIDFVYYEQSLYSWEYGNVIPSIMNASMSAIESFDDERIYERLMNCDWMILEINEGFIPMAVLDQEKVGSQFWFLKMADSVFADALAHQISNEKQQEIPQENLDETEWLNFVPFNEDFMLMGRNRGTINMKSLADDTLMELKIPWRDYEQYCPGISHQVTVFADGRQIATLTPEGNAVQHLSMKIPAGTSKIEIFSTGQMNVVEEIDIQTIFYSLFIRLREGG